jgi:hypothetical protein
MMWVLFHPTFMVSLVLSRMGVGIINLRRHSGILRVLPGLGKHLIEVQEPLLICS